MNILLALFPVIFFLTGLTALDSYRLVRFPRVLLAILMGMCAAGVSYIINVSIINLMDVDVYWYTRLGAPPVEETMKSLYIAWLMHRNRIGFMVDGAIVGFAIGTGFALCENVYYLTWLDESNRLLWLVRGLGTAVMHGGATAILAILAKRISDHRDRVSVISSLPGLAIAIAIHSAFNFSPIGPLGSMLVIVVVVPPLLVYIFALSEKATRAWLGVGFDSDVDLLGMITGGEVAGTRIGEYLQSLKERFPGEIIADMLCLLRLQLELAVRAKGVLLMRESGFEIHPDPEIGEKFREINYLKKNIGKTGLLAMSPLLGGRGNESWQYQILKEG